LRQNKYLPLSGQDMEKPMTLTVNPRKLASLFTIWFGCMAQELPPGPGYELPITAPSRPSLGQREAQNPPTFDLGALRPAEMSANDGAVGKKASARAISRNPGPEARAHGRWLDRDRGDRYWTVRMSGGKALAIRVKFGGFHAGGGRVWVWGSGAKGPIEKGPYVADGQFGDGVFWSDLIPGDTLTIEYAPEPIAGKQGFDIPFEILDVQLIYGLGPLAAATYPGIWNDGIDRRCFKDAMCYANNSQVVTAINPSVYLINPNVGSCSGTIMNTKTGSSLLLTAGHCLDPGQERNLIIVPRYQTGSCNGAFEDNPWNLPHVTGASMLGWSFRPDGVTPDYAVLLPSAPVPVARTSGWRTAAPGPTELLLSVSHPRNMPSSLMQARLRPNGVSAAFFGVQPIVDGGRTDHGSSGSGIHDATGEYLYGVTSTVANTDAVSACSVAEYYSGYTRFNVIYEATKRLWDEALAIPSPVINSFTAAPQSIEAGRTSTLQWNVSGADLVTIEPGIGVVGPSGSRTVSPQSTVQYTLTATKGGASPAINRVTVSVTANPSPQAPVIGAFSASPLVIAAGGVSTLSWNVSGASSITISPGVGSVPPSGTFGVRPTASTAYVLTASNPAGVRTASVTVTVGSAGGNRPIVNPGGVVTVAAGAPLLTPLGLVSIYGQNFTNGVTQHWDGAALRTSLAGVTVMMDGRPAYPLYVSPTFMNVQVPNLNAAQAAAVTVTNANGTSSPVQVLLAGMAPEFKGWSPTHVEALRSGPRPPAAPTCPYLACPVAPAGMVPFSTPAQPGEVISLWGMGFGASSPAIAAGSIGSPAPLANPVTVTVGGVQAAVPWGGYLQGVGLYQVNIIVPSLPDGEYDLVATVGGVRTLKTMRLAIRR